MNGRRMDLRQLAATLRGAGLSDRESTGEDVLSRSGKRILGLEVPLRDAEDAWRLWLGLREQTGFHPVLSELPPSALVGGQIADGDEYDGRAETAPREIVAEIVEAALLDHLDGAGEEEAAEWHTEFVPERLAARLRDGFTPEPGGTLRLEDRDERSLYWTETLWLNLVETEQGYSVPRLLPGFPGAPNWFHGPEGRPILDSDHVAFLHTWFERFGAELIYLDGSNLRLWVARPPRDLLETARVAIEQYAYCPDRRDLEVIGNGQARSDAWSFWWD
ncbi:DUF4253 domain-containing protein [Streptomyces sp. NPDC051219]|uniref:DUF4253 domain-containing protein n=1 Tax=Streptomyces sp. NPDC051219 TaxID=3155283 RepID=UPI00343A0046